MKSKMKSQGYSVDIEHLYKSYYRQLYLYALTFLDDKETAMDVINDAFERVLLDWQKGDCRQETVLGYLYRLIRNYSLDILRHRKVHDRYMQMKLATEKLEDASPSEVMDFENRIVRLRNAVDELPEPDRSILKCCYFKKRTYKETAAELQITVNVVHKRMVSAFRQLRQMLKNDE